jgi:hypothetical protein
MTGIKFGDIEDAFLFVGSAPYGDHSAFLNIQTGQIFYRSESGDLDEVDEEDVDWEHTIEIPHKNDLGLGKDLVFDFVSANLPRDYDLVRSMFGRRGAYSRFKDFLGSKGMLEKWYHFENSREQEELRLWCQENEIPLSDE